MARLNLRIRDGAGGGLTRVLWTLFGVVFFAAGCFALWGVGQQVYDGARTWFWDPVPCTVESSEVVATGGDPGWRFAVTYRWHAGGREHTGDRVRPGYQGSRLTAANSLAVSYPPGLRTTCWVDPDEPSAATLERPAVWRASILLFPWPFIGVGAFLLWMVFGGGRWSRRPGRRPVAPAATSADVDPGKAMGCAMAFCAVFLVAGLALFIPFFLVPALHSLDAREWRQVPATIVSSAVDSHHGDDSTTYSIEVVYRYRVDGREFRSDRYHFLSGSTSGYEGKAEVVRGLPAGAEVTAWVDPDNPGSAVLSRELGSQWLFGLLPLVFVAAGAGGMVLVWRGSRRHRRREAAGIESWMPDRADGEPAGEDRYLRSSGAEEQYLEAQHSPLGKLGLALFFCLAWNGIVGVFLGVLWNEYRSGGRVDGCLAAFLLPFVVVGLLLLVSVPYQFLALANPRPRLRLGGRLEPGATVDLSWTFTGRAGRIRAMKITLTGEEKATYRRGTDTHTASETFFEEVVYDSQAGMGVVGAGARLEIPADTMHSFAAPNNQVVWTLAVHGVIGRWPDVLEQFPLVVHPKEVGP